MKKMKVLIPVFLLFTLTIVLGSCEKEDMVFEKGDYIIEIETGEAWLHDFPLFPGVKTKNTPQFAIWVEDTVGNFIANVYVTQKVATEGWLANKGNRRIEALPHWMFQRNVKDENGILLPSKKQPLPDAVTGATPKADSRFRLKLAEPPFVVKAEFNHSTDFNEHYPKNATVGTPNYSGGEMGGGQPALVYAATVDGSENVVELKLLGHSSADGSCGNIFTNTDHLDSALKIVNKITVKLF